MDNGCSRSTMPDNSNTNRNHSDTATSSQGELYCRKCGYSINWCICRTDYIDFLEERKQASKKIMAYIHNTKPSIIPIRKNLHSLSGMKGIALLKRIDKR